VADLIEGIAMKELHGTRMDFANDIATSLWTDGTATVHNRKTGEVTELDEYPAKKGKHAHRAAPPLIAPADMVDGPLIPGGVTWVPDNTDEPVLIEPAPEPDPPPVKVKGKPGRKPKVQTS
jgi:hypothetical protein